MSMKLDSQSYLGQIGLGYMQIAEVRKCLNCGSQMYKSEVYYLCNVCQSFFSERDLENMLQDKRIAHDRIISAT